ncbi:MAG: 2Fe-2S iron-sulfur cluster-binding protein [Bacteroidia bacterium]|nr:2Fe-2S iron-sulfur cluster-binding protein [Bacteroidia bacterium]MDW8333461.1 2Fe-2S iron-sulfur cluster-binding protein [Bacteroidia bacterium]
MGKINIDGVDYAFEGNHKLLAFALSQGVEIPYFCYHPEMSIPTNCRMCLVEVGFPATGPDRQPLFNEDGTPKINWGRKPATSCNQDVFDGMYVRTHRTSPVIQKAQKGVLEFILINHPLDCPICDQAGECPLQINTYKYGPEGSRFELNKVHKPKRVHLGPNVILDAERCINCTRCTRFTEEISKSNQLTIISRGEKNFPATAPGKVFDDPYSMNVVDLCPVGALTSADFRFKARVWEMNYTPSICTECARNCSVDVWVRDNLVLRQTPRENPAVNRHWMCDEGRLAYEKFNRNRVSGAKVVNDVPTELSAALVGVAESLKKHKGEILWVGSAYASLETNYALKKLAQHLGDTTIYFVNRYQKGWGDDFLRRDERTPNAAACRMLGFVETTFDELMQKSAKLAFVVEDDGVAEKLTAAGIPVVSASYHYYPGYEKALVVLPAAMHIEAQGTYINFENVVQVVMQAKAIARMTPEMWMSMPKSRLEAGGVAVDNWRNPEHAIDCLPGWMLISQIAKNLGADFYFQTHKEIFKALQDEFEPIRPIRLPKRNRKESFKMSQFEFAIR